MRDARMAGLKAQQLAARQDRCRDCALVAERLARATRGVRAEPRGKRRSRSAKCSPSSSSVRSTYI
jgi:hypothetical protein